MAHSKDRQKQTWQGPAVFSHGFRAFFLFGAAWALVAMALWLPAMIGELELPTRFDPVTWHAHAFLFGYLGAVLAGFLLTAVPNWTGRLPLLGWPLVALFALWGAGRLAILFSAHLSAGLVMVVDLAFPLVLAAAILREIVTAKNWRNLMVLAMLGVFTLANAVFHLEAMYGGSPAQGIGLRLGVATAVMMISVIGGRIIPSFTRNWLVRQNNPARPAPPMQRFDKAVLLASIAILLTWVFAPEGQPTGAALLVFGVLHLIRLSRWQGHLTWRDPLVCVLHLSYAFIPFGGICLGVDLLLGHYDSAAVQHLWMTGAIGTMTLAVMTRASLGHSGRPLVANLATSAIYLGIFGAAIFRLATPLAPEWSYAAGLFWLIAFGGFVLAYGPMLLFPRKDCQT